jgi:hypothetical protein
MSKLQSACSWRGVDDAGGTVRLSSLRLAGVTFQNPADWSHMPGLSCCCAWYATLRCCCASQPAKAAAPSAHAHCLPSSLHKAAVAAALAWWCVRWVQLCIAVGGACTREW